MNAKLVFSLVVSVTVLCSFGVNLNNGDISVEVNGDGRIGALQFLGSNHINECSIRLRHSSAMFTTKKISSTEVVYNDFQMMTGYGRQPDSNMYIVCASRICGTNTSVDQTLVILGRDETQLGVTYYLNANVQQTPEHDYGTFNGANHTIVQHESARYIGLLGERNSQPPDSHVVDERSIVEGQLQQSVLSGVVISNSPPDMAAAVAWNNVTVNRNAVVVKTKVMAGTSDLEIQNLTNSDDPPIHVLSDSDISLKLAKFSQKFNKAGKDKVKLKGEIDATDFPGVFDNMSNLDVSLFLGDYLAFLPGDGSETKVKKGKRIHKLDTPAGKRSLNMKAKKGIIKFTASISKANLRPATLLNANTPDGLKQQMHLPWALVLTGTNPNDTEKGGNVWIIGMNVSMEFDKKNEKSVKGKMPK
jgi:hypothetical protein